MPRNSARQSEMRTRYYIRELAKERGWDVRRVGNGGDFLEENEIVNQFPDIGLGQDKPDFVICRTGEPVIVIEAKKNVSEINTASNEAKDYADTINQAGRYHTPIAVGAAGTKDTGFLVEVFYYTAAGWHPLVSRGYQLTSIPSVDETHAALQAADGSTQVRVPESSEFIDAAVELSNILRQAKVEAPLRPKVIGAIVTAMYEGTIDTRTEYALESINALCQQAIDRQTDVDQGKRDQLKEAIRLLGSDFDRLAPSIGRVVSILRRLNIRSVLNTDTDFLGMFYEAFLRYGYDNNALGIVFTPRHITRFAVDLVGVGADSKVIDIASGTGGFLVSAFDRMRAQAHTPEEFNEVKGNIHGLDTNPTVWALALLNMFFRGDGKSHIALGDCFDAHQKATYRRNFDRAFLNPPFSQEGEPESMFIDASMEALRPQRLFAGVVYAGVFADDHHKEWRKRFLRQHTLVGMISLPEEVFYPTAAPTSIIIAKAHRPQNENDRVFMARIWNDGFEKLKNKRVPVPGSQLPTIVENFHSFLNGEEVTTDLATIIRGAQL